MTNQTKVQLSRQPMDRIASWLCAKQGCEHLTDSGCNDPKRLGCSDPKRLGCSDPKRPGCSDPKRPGCGDPKRHSGSLVHDNCHTSSVVHLQSFGRPSLCLWCRRCCYAEAAVGKKDAKALTRYQEWCLPLLPASQGRNMYVGQIFDIMRLAGYHLQHAQTICRPLSLQAQALQGTRSCTCATLASVLVSPASCHKPMHLQSASARIVKGERCNSSSKTTLLQETSTFVAARQLYPCRWIACRPKRRRRIHGRQYKRQRHALTMAAGKSDLPETFRGGGSSDDKKEMSSLVQNRSAPSQMFQGALVQKQPWSGGGKRKYHDTDARKCFFCAAVGADYHPFAVDDFYVASCALCERLACNQCGSWELRQFYCPWCVDNHRISEEGCQTMRAVKMCAKAYQGIEETVDWSDHLLFAQTVLQLCHRPGKKAMNTDLPV